MRADSLLHDQTCLFHSALKFVYSSYLAVICYLNIAKYEFSESEITINILVDRIGEIFLPSSFEIKLNMFVSIIFWLNEFTKAIAFETFLL